MVYLVTNWSIFGYVWWCIFHHDRVLDSFPFLLLKCLWNFIPVHWYVFRYIDVSDITLSVFVLKFRRVECISTWVSTKINICKYLACFMFPFISSSSALCWRNFSRWFLASSWMCFKNFLTIRRLIIAILLIVFLVMVAS